MIKTFIEGLKTPFAGLVKTYKVKDKKTGQEKDLAYLAWSRAIALAGRPAQEVIHWGATPYFEVFGGAVVGVKQTVELKDGVSFTQDTLLPVLDGANRPIPIQRCTSRDISDAINRCRAKSVAMVSGVGLSLFSHATADTLTFIRNLKVLPTSDLSTVEPLISLKDGRSPYVDWPSALAAVRLTDAGFQWEIVWSEYIDARTAEICKGPVIRTGTGWMVGVKATYKGFTHTEYLPIMGVLEVDTANGRKALDHQPLVNATAHDWHRAVMRCLVKAIAIVSGYGLSVYAKEELEALQVEPLAPRSNANTATEAQPEREAPKVDPEAIRSLAVQLEKGLADKQKGVADMLVWLGKPSSEEDAKLPVVDQLVRLSHEELSRGLVALGLTAMPNEAVH